MTRLLTIIGLFFTLIGSALLFFYGLPKSKVGNVAFVGDTAMKWEPGPGERDIPDNEWQREVDFFRDQAALWNRLGFGLVAFGTLLQLAAAW